LEISRLKAECEKLKKEDEFWQNSSLHGLAKENDKLKAALRDAREIVQLAIASEVYNHREKSTETHGECPWPESMAVLSDCLAKIRALEVADERNK